jgi:hypothetical protein
MEMPFVSRREFLGSAAALDLSSATWCATPAGRVICVDLPRGASELEV